MAKVSKPRNPALPPVTRKVPAVTRAVAILQYLAAVGTPVGVVTLARAIGLIPSTCLHILRVLAEENLVSFDPQTKQYSIGHGVLAFSQPYANRNPLVQLARRWLHGLSQEHRCAFAAVQPSGPDHYIVVEIGDAYAGLSVRVSVGARFPILSSATGLCFATFGDWSEEQLRRGFERLPWEEAPSFEQWFGLVEETRRLGYAVDDGGYIRGAKIIAVPIFKGNGAILGSISAVGLSEQLCGERLDRLIAGMLAMEQAIDQAMGAHSPQPRAPTTNHPTVSVV